MIDLKPNDQARLRRTFRFLDDQAPLGPDLPELVEATVSAGRRSRRLNPSFVVTGTVLVTLLLFLPIALLLNEPDPLPSEQTPAGSIDPSGSGGTLAPLATGDNWSIGIWENGSEICYRFNFDGPFGEATGEACPTPSSFSIPDVLNVHVTTFHDESGILVYEEIVGIVTEEVDRLVIAFPSGGTIELEPGETVRYGYRGFGVTGLDAKRLGEPTTIEVFNGEMSLGVYSHEKGRPVD